MFYAVLKLVHVLGVVLWVGGMFFAHFFLRPALEVLDAPQRVRLMHGVLRRFFAAVLVVSLATLFSGLWMIGRVAKQAVQGGGSFQWPLDWVVMTVVGILMVAIFGHIRFVLFKRLDRALVASDWPAGGAALASIRTWVAVNLGLGLALIAVVLLV
jgi:uncharacterized membrane protein